MIYVNGAAQPLIGQMSIWDYLVKQKYLAARVAVELNGRIVPKAAYHSTIIRDQDQVEIVCFVGGG